jgi:hypothetical protein
MLFHFKSIIGYDAQHVDVVLHYESDQDGIYDSWIHTVDYRGVDICGCLTDDVISDLEMQGLNALETEKRESWEE